MFTYSSYPIKARPPDNVCELDFLQERLLWVKSFRIASENQSLISGDFILQSSKLEEIF